MRISLPGLVGALAALVATLVLAPAASGAQKVPCVVGYSYPGMKKPKCKVQEAKAKHAADGDTVKPQLLLPNGKWSEKRSVRVIGIQTPELKNYSRKEGRKGECMGVEAAELLDTFVKGRFRIVAQKMKTGKGSRGRLRASIQAKRGGRWVYPAMELIRRGLAVWSPNGKDWAWNGAYSRLAEEAAAKGVGLWNPEACGKPGPAQGAVINMKVKWNGQGRETANSEYVRLSNASASDIPLRGWSLYDPGVVHRWQFPANAVIPAGQAITIRMGKGTNGNGTYYYGSKSTMFQNASADKRQLGDSVYLFDPDGEMRTHMQWPCRTTCADPLDRKIDVRAKYESADHEWITLTNKSSAPVSLDGYELENVPWFYEFGPRDVLNPGRSLVLWRDNPHRIPVGPLGPGRLQVDPFPGLFVPGPLGVDFRSADIFRSWGINKPLLGDKSDVVVLRTPSGQPVAGGCHAWGGDRCPSA